MSSSILVSTPRYGDDTLPCSANLGFPSPAAEDLSLATPSPNLASHIGGGIANSWIPADSDLSVIPKPIPGGIALQTVPSPAQETAPVLGLDAIVGAAVDPAPSFQSFVLPEQTKPGPGLRLPSFDLLGIANPRPDLIRRSAIEDTPNACYGSLSLDGGFDESTTISEPSRGGHSTTMATSIESPRAHSRVPLPSLSSQRVINTITPLDDDGRLIWDSIATVSTGAMESPNTDPGNETTTRTLENRSVPEGAGHPRININRTDSGEIVDSWLGGATDVLMANMQAGQYSNPIKVLSHALPCPSSTGHAFPHVISVLHNQTPTSPTCWINVFHALPGRFTLADLPSSPPNTPGPPIGGDDYFTSKVFDSAVPILDYQENVTAMPRSPRPAVPPSTIDVSIVERYIPPTNANEFTDMFNINGRSLLVDRLVELSPNNGTLLFIYPTKQGAQTFLRDYLGPILDPLVRSMCVINGLSVDLGSSLGKMSAAETMLSHDGLRMNISQLCHKLNQQSDRLERFHNRPAKFSLEYATKQLVKLDRKVWAENWWVKQEKPRVRDVVSRYFRLARRLPTDSEIAPTNLIHEVLDGVASRPYGNSPEPTLGVEVGVFVIKRSK